MNLNLNVRVALALGMVAVAFATAVYLHQRHTWTSGFASSATDNPLLSDATPESVRSHPSWADPAALLIAIGGVAVALLVVGSGSQQRVR